MAEGGPIISRLIEEAHHEAPGASTVCWSRTATIFVFWPVRASTLRSAARPTRLTWFRKRCSKRINTSTSSTAKPRRS